MDRELKEFKKMMHEQNENSNKELESIKRNEVGILVLKSIITDIKNLVEGFSIKYEQAEERLSEPE